jgi:predicted nucleic acid-binding protein
MAIPQLRDQNDVKILATAIASQSQILITGDLDLLVLNPFKSMIYGRLETIEILTPSDFQ